MPEPDSHNATGILHARIGRRQLDQLKSTGAKMKVQAAPVP